MDQKRDSRQSKAHDIRSTVERDINYSRYNYWKHLVIFFIIYKTICININLFLYFNNSKRITQVTSDITYCY